MRTIHLMQLVCGNAGKAARSFDAMLRNDLNELRVIYSLTLTSWISVTITGSQEQVAGDLLVKQYGELRDPQPGDIARAWLAGINDNGIALDTGCKRVLVPFVRLEPFGRGTVEQIASRFGLIHCLPLQVRLVGEFDAEFTKNQIDAIVAVEKRDRPDKCQQCYARADPRGSETEWPRTRCLRDRKARHFGALYRL
jgi:hypothetical protein